MSAAWAERIWPATHDCHVTTPSKSSPRIYPTIPATAGASNVKPILLPHCGISPSSASTTAASTTTACGSPRVHRRTRPRRTHGPAISALAAIGQIIEQIADALDTAADHGLTHRDVKPANILLPEHPEHIRPGAVPSPCSPVSVSHTCTRQCRRLAAGRDGDRHVTTRANVSGPPSFGPTNTPLACPGHRYRVCSGTSVPGHRHETDHAFRSRWRPNAFPNGLRPPSTPCRPEPWRRTRLYFPDNPQFCSPRHRLFTSRHLKLPTVQECGNITPGPESDWNNQRHSSSRNRSPPVRADTAARTLHPDPPARRRALLIGATRGSAGSRHRVRRHVAAVARRRTGRRRDGRSGN